MDSTPLLIQPANLLRRYHRHRVVGIKNIPLKGPALIVAHHSFATYDSFLLGAAILEERGRLVHALGHRWLFKLPLVRELMNDAGAVSASPESAKNLLREGHLLGVAPGGMREALRSKDERYKVRWADRKGFVRLAIEMQTPIVLVACPRADEIFDISTGFFTDLAYEKLRLPLVFAWGRGPLPRPIELVHYVEKAQEPPACPRSAKKLSEVVDRWHAELTQAMSKLLERRD
jgi:hypothetical protein